MVTARDGVEEYRTLAERPEPDYALGAGWRALRLSSVVLGLIPVLMVLQTVLGGGAAGEGRDAGLAWTAALTWAVCVVGPAVLSRFPQVFNYPTMLTSENVQRLYRLGAVTMILVAAGCTVTLWGVTATLGLPAGWLSWVGIAGLTAAVIWAVRASLRA
ncbi:hypothetical protein [Nesterenkonia sp. F]|uniref:hypothetical protein n=1 Tax=Nesterenkonia sp. F TaxID=795955 RepID=UPI000255CEA4|nr:hypothetical protein [Nesterenkonia sp. F]